MVKITAQEFRSAMRAYGASREGKVSGGARTFAIQDDLRFGWRWFHVVLLTPLADSIQGGLDHLAEIPDMRVWTIDTDVVNVRKFVDVVVIEQ